MLFIDKSKRETVLFVLMDIHDGNRTGTVKQKFCPCLFYYVDLMGDDLEELALMIMIMGFILKVKKNLYWSST